MVTMPRIQITRDLQTPSYLKRPVNLRESTSLLAGVFLAPFTGEGTGPTKPKGLSKVTPLGGEAILKAALPSPVHPAEPC